MALTRVFLVKAIVVFRLDLVECHVCSANERR